LPISLKKASDGSFDYCPGCRRTVADLRSRVENYLRSTGKEELNLHSARFQDASRRSRGWLYSCGSLTVLRHLVQLLKERDISEEEANNIIGQLESTAILSWVGKNYKNRRN